MPGKEGMVKLSSDDYVILEILATDHDVEVLVNSELATSTMYLGMHGASYHYTYGCITF